MKLNSLWKGLSMILLNVCLYSCNPGNISCPGLESQYSAWLPYKANDVVTYVNNNGQEIQFAVKSYEVSTPKTLECSPYKCPSCPELRSIVAASTQDTSRKIGKIVYSSLYSTITKPDGKGDSVYLYYQVFDHRNSIAIGPSFKPNRNDSALTSFTVGGRTYSNVIVHQVDTTAAPYPNPIYNVYFVWKSYYNKDFGVIAFYDLKTRAFFYRKS